MTAVPDGLQLLSELLSGVSREDPEALGTGMRQLAGVFDATLVALLAPDALQLGVGVGEADRCRLLASAPQRPERLLLAAGPLHLHWVPLGPQDLLVAGRPDEPFRAEERSLLQAMARTIQLSRRLAAAEAAEREAREAALRQACRDPITGLPGRSSLLGHLERLLAGSPVPGEPVATVLVIDIDRLRLLNDLQGHPAGDRSLIVVAGVLGELAAGHELLARLPGDQFVLLCRSRSRSEAESLAARVIATIHQPLLLEGRLLHVSASVGLAVAAPGDGAERLLENAELAMAAARQRGRGGFLGYEPELRQRARQRAVIETELRRALAAGELVPHYQPIIDGREERVRGFEALARWRHGERGLLLPTSFIAVAEETGQIVEIDRQILRQACHTVARWQARDPSRPLSLSVNLSARSLADPALLPWVRQALADSGLDPRALHLEITETMLVDDRASIAEVLDQLSALGVRLVIDDFGTGYSSLLYLKRFPVRILKIDRSFIEGLGRDPGDEVIVEAVARVSRALGIGLIAEGVETRLQAQRLLELGCDGLQGQLYGPPREAAAIEAMFPDLSPRPAQAAGRAGGKWSQADSNR